MSKTTYTDLYHNINFRDEPQKYAIGKGEQGVLIAEPYKSEILPYWKFATPTKAQTSASTIYNLFIDYKNKNDFVGMDMARKFLQMGFTRSRRYANHSSGIKYDATGSVREKDIGSEQSDKAKSARIFYKYYLKAKDDADYLQLKKEHQQTKHEALN